MKPPQLYDELKALAEKLGITVTEANLRSVGLPVQSGLCRVRNEMRFILDKHQSLPQKIEILAECLDEQPLEEVFVVPALREFFAKRRVRPQPSTVATQNNSAQSKS